MAAPKRSVDDIWKELNARKAAPRSTSTGIPGFGIPGVTTHTRILPKQPATAAQPDVPASHDQQQQQHRPAVPAYDPAAVGVSNEELGQCVAGLQRTINCLSDPDRGTRKTAITALHSKLLTGDAATPKASPNMLQALLVGPLLQPLSALLSDPLEHCRLSALQLLLDAVPLLPDAGALLPGLTPALVARMGALPVQEPAEEVRLAGLQLLGDIISRAPARQLAPCVEESSLLLARGLEDSFPEAKKAAAAALTSLAGKLPPGALETQAERLLQAALPSLSHQHSKVRLAVLSGLRSLVLSGLPAGMVQEQLVPVIKPLTFDRAASVREEYYAALASWLGSSRPHESAPQQEAEAEAAAAHARCRTYAPALLPLLLLGISDPQQSIAAASLAAVEQAGAAWQEQTQAAAGAGAAAADGAIPMDTGELDSLQPLGDVSSQLSLSPAAIAAAQLPSPYHGLPAAGSRAMVAALLPQLLPGTLGGLKEWTTSLRSAAARSLHTLLVFGGPAAAAHLQQLLAALTAAVSDDDSDIVTLLTASCKVLGAFVPSSSWLPLLVDAVADPKAGPASRASTLLVLSCLVHAATAAGQPADQQLLALLVGALADDDTRGCDHVGVQTQLLAVVANLLAWMPPEAVQASGQQLYLILLQLHGAAEAGAAAGSAGASQATVAAVMQQLAQHLGLSGLGQLAERHAQQLLPVLTADAAAWTASSPHLQVFMSLLRTAEASCLCQLLPQVARLLQPMLGDADRDAALRLALLQLLDELLESPQASPAFGGSNSQLVLQSLLLPPLVWRAGKAAAAVRFAAITALATFIAAALAPPDVLLAACAAKSGLLPLLAQCLDEDWYTDVRLTACYILQQLLQQVGSSLDDEARRGIYPELLKRLDDSNNKVRVAACAALVAFVASAGPGYCSTNSGYLAAGVVLHMDDGDAAVAEAACQVLEALACTKPGVAVAEVVKVQERFRARHYCDRVLAAAKQRSSDEAGTAVTTH